MTRLLHMYFIHGLFLIISIPLILEKIGPNELYGMRVGKALWNNENWYKANRFSGWSMLITAVISILYVFSLQLLKKSFPEFNISIPYIIGLIVAFATGYATIPLVYCLVMHDSKERPMQKRHSMDPLKTWYAVAVYVWICLILIVFALPYAFNQVPPNGTAGFRIGKTLANPEIWYKANHFMGISMIVSGVYSAVSILFIKLYLGKVISWLNNGLIYLLLFVVPIFVAFIAAPLYVAFL